MRTAKLSKISSSASIVATMLCALPHPVPAAANDNEAVAVSDSRMVVWRARISEMLDKALAQSSAARLMPPNDCVVQVLFSIGTDGRAINIRLVSEDANWGARRAASYAVRKLVDLDTIPLDRMEDVRLRADIIFAARPEDRARLEAKLTNGHLEATGMALAPRLVVLRN